MGQALAHYFSTKLKEGARQPKPGDFYGHHLPEPEMSDEAMLAMMQAFAKVQNKRTSEG